MQPQTFGYITVQPDWQLDVNAAPTAGSPSKAPKFWASAYKQDSTSIHDTIKVSHTTPEAGAALVSLDSEKGISAEYVDKRHIRLSSSELKIPPTLFSAPSKTIECAQISNRSGIASFDISRYGGLAVVCGSDGEMNVYETETGEHRAKLAGHVGDVTCCQFFPSGQVVLSGGADMRLKIWSASDGSNPVTMIGHTAPVTDIAVVGVGKNVVSASKDGTVRLWHCGSASVLHMFDLSEAAVNSIVVIEKCADALGGSKGTVDSSDDERENEFETKGAVVVAGCEDGRTFVLDLYNRRAIATLVSSKLSPVRSAVLDSQRGLAFVGLGSGVVEIWDVRNTKAERVHSFKRNNSPISKLCLVQRRDGGPALCVSTEDGQLYMVALVYANGAVSEVEVVEELVGFDVDPVYQVRAVSAAEKDATRQAVWASGRKNLVFEY